MRKDGKVYIVGAGPGDPELMTVKARRVINNADVVLHDSLVGDEVVESIPATVDSVNVGKNPYGHRTPQEEINRLMEEHTGKGRDVVRLKAGDPCVFGRGGEESEYLADAGIEFDIIPGVTSAVSACATGIPTTHREHASSFTVVTGHEDPTKKESALNWGALASNVVAGGTLVILMGVRRLPENVNELVENGVDPSKPAAMVEKATHEDERVVTSTLDGIVEEARDTDIEPPALTVIGDVVNVRDDVVAWLDDSGASEALSGHITGVPYHG